jgi:hypothetical protein
MVKKSLKHEPHPHHGVMIILVSFVAVLAIMAANTDSNAGALAVKEPISCSTDRSCALFEYVNSKTCVEYHLVPYSICTDYTSANDCTMKTMYDEVCSDWIVSKEKVCLKWEYEQSCN